jgi:DNA-binding MarR family transcriptional regulator
MDLIGEFRAFNRFYTRRIGLLQRSLPGGDLSLPMARVLYEIATASSPPTAADLMRALDMDKAHLSRLIARLRARGLIEARAETGRRVALSPTPEGRETFAALDRASAEARLVDAVIARARSAGYRALVLWTNDILTAARQIYVSRGFQLIDEAPHRSFGADLVGQTWRLALD